MPAPDLATADFSTLLVEEREDRVVVLLNRPEVRNAIDQQMVDGAAPGLRRPGEEPQEGR